MKLKFHRNKNLSTTIDKGRYTLSDVSNLVNKINSKNIRLDDDSISSKNIAKKQEILQK